MRGRSGVEERRALLVDPEIIAALLLVGCHGGDQSRDEYMEEDCSIRPEFRALALARLQELLGSKPDA